MHDDDDDHDDAEGYVDIVDFVVAVMIMRKMMIAVSKHRHQQ
jgi:hypothetical protein